MIKDKFNLKGADGGADSAAPPSHESQPENIPDCIDDRFEVIELLGKGGMGTVYKVRDLEVDGIFALKILHQNLTSDTAALKRFELEAKAAAQLTHPNLISVFANGVTNSGEAYLLMEFVEGETLAQAIEKDGVIDEERSISIFRQICEALSHAHEHDVIHRDIKPANIILSKTESGDEIARVVDFGIAKTLPAADRETRDLTQTGEVFGSPHYMSPEQCLGFMLDQRSDIYSLGCLMYETISGKPPFAGSNPIQLVVKHINDPAKPFLGSFGKQTKLRSLQSIALRCLEKQQLDRFQDVDDIAEALEDARQGRPVTFGQGKLKYSTIEKELTPFAVLMPILIAVATALPLVQIQSKPSDALSISETVAHVALLGAGVIVAVGAAGLFNLSQFFIRLTRDRMASERYWWQTHIILLSGLTIGGFVPLLMTPSVDSVFGGVSQMQALLPLWDFVVVVGIAVTAVAGIAVVACGIGYGLAFKNTRKVKMTSVTTKATLFSLVAAIAFFSLWLKPITVLCSWMGEGLTNARKKHSSGIGTKMIDLCSNLNPGEKRILESRITSNVAHNRYKKIVADLSTMIEMTPESEKSTIASYLDRRAYAYSRLGDEQKALEDRSKHIALSPYKSDAYYRRARCYLKLNRVPEAIADFGKTIALDPSAAYAYFARASAYLDHGEPGKALEDLSRELSLEYGKVPEVYACRGLAFEHLRQPDKAKKDFEAAIDTTDNEWRRKNLHPYIGRAVAHAKLKTFDKAREAYKLAKSSNNFSMDELTWELERYPEELQTRLKEAVPELQSDLAKHEVR